MLFRSFPEIPEGKEGDPLLRFVARLTSRVRSLEGLLGQAIRGEVAINPASRPDGGGGR